VALAWVLHQPFPVFPLVGPANLEEMRSCLAALELELTPEEVCWLDVRNPGE
jgi:aryl-alcohol dehydrogenase-like predicted oxidoreductase